MLERSGLQPTEAKVIQPTTEDWPDKRATDIGWAYVSIEGGSEPYREPEAVTVIVCVLTFRVQPERARKRESAMFA